MSRPGRFPRMTPSQSEAPEPAAPASANVVAVAGRVTARDRAGLTGHAALTVWFTGLSGSGKSTLAYATEERLVAGGVLACVLDGDNLRFGLCGDLGFSPTDRAENIRRAGEAAALLHSAGVVVLASFISPYRRDRQRVRAIHPPGGFVEVFVDAPLEVCEARDPKGLYAKARAGEISDLTGVDAPYEAPTRAEMRICTSSTGVALSADAVVAAILKRIRPAGTRVK